ncbi:hypothetical protein ACFOGJ_02770 [Marinibaculum pumilum]|uniref:Type II toxin-antitoxin system PemK/MazF family toxin n=1 Tax=Marinibaculum pumilum TaxID=1766165 RepID=A0ABV7KUY3_9PROT
MKLPALTPGLVIRYEYLWGHEYKAGQLDGSKARPCAVVIIADDQDGRRDIYVSPISHQEPEDGTGIPIPPKVADYLGLDDLGSWIVTTEVNQVTQIGDAIPPGIVPAFKTKDIFGHLPNSLLTSLLNVFRTNLAKGSVTSVSRDDDTANYRTSRGK